MKLQLRKRNNVIPVEWMNEQDKIAELKRALEKLRVEQRKKPVDTYKVLEAKQDINNKMIRWGVADPTVFGAIQEEIDP